MLSTTREYQSTDLIVNRPLPQGLDRVTHKLIGKSKRARAPLKSFATQAASILEKAEAMRPHSDGRLRQELEQHRKAIRRNRQHSTEATIEALPALIEAAWRMTKLRPYPEQIMGMLALQGNYIAEMATGEGKTLTIALAGVTAGWTQLPCHIITANDYLAERDAETMRRLYEFAGVSVAFVTGPMSPQERQAAYAADVVYTTSKELVADFLRDRLRLKRLHPANFRANRKLANTRFDATRHLIQRGLHTAIVDEADNLLIDEAVTPLIISQPQKNKELQQAIRKADSVARTLVEGEDYEPDNEKRRVELLDGARHKLQQSTEEVALFYRESSWMEELLEKALAARLFFKKDHQYVIQEGAVVIVDDFTGRLMPGRSWKQGLQQAIEAKEGLAITDPSESIASLSFQRFFRFFKHLSALTGTAEEAAGEFWTVYNLTFIRIPRHRPCIREDHPATIHRSLQDKWAAIAKEIQEVHRSGRPVLVGTRSIHDSETLSETLTRLGLQHRLLNASREQEEAQIISLAGNRGGITIATNMAGRGTDIKLSKEVIALGGLHVIATDMNESHRIDRQLYGRAGRQGDPGSSSTHISLEDELFEQHAPSLVQAIRSYTDKSLPAHRSLAHRAFKRTQKKAENKARRQRQGVMRKDSWLEEMFAMSGLEIGD